MHSAPSGSSSWPCYLFTLLVNIGLSSPSFSFLFCSMVTAHLNRFCRSLRIVSGACLHSAVPFRCIIFHHALMQASDCARTDIGRTAIILKLFMAPCTTFISFNAKLVSRPRSGLVCTHWKRLPVGLITIHFIISHSGSGVVLQVLAALCFVIGSPIGLKFTK